MTPRWECRHPHGEQCPSEARTARRKPALDALSAGRRVKSLGCSCLCAPPWAARSGGESSNRTLGEVSMAITATLLRPGAVIMHNKDLHQVFSVEHRTPGNKRGFIQAKLRNLRTGSMIDYKFRAEDSVDKVVLDEVQMEYLYKDGDDYYFMNIENYEQMHMTRDTLGDAVEYLTPNLQ